MRLVRVEAQPLRTFGELYVNDVRYCWTLEDTLRPPGVKVPKKTAIPFGIYPVTIGWSPRFQRLMPRVEAVPGFVGILVHNGNTEADTDGCILVGEERTEATIERSRAALRRVMHALNTAKARGERTTLEIVSAEGVHPCPA